MIGILAVPIYAAASLAAGVVVMRAIHPNVDGAATATARVVSAYVLGQGLLSQVLLVAGLAGKLNPTVAIALPLIVVAVAAKPALRWLAAFSSEVRDVVGRARVAPLSQAAVVLLLCVCAIALGIAAFLYAPIGDAEALYLAYPKFIAAMGRLAPFRGLYEPTSSIGLVGELNFVELLMLAGPREAKLFAWLTGMAGVVMLTETGRSSALRWWGCVVLAGLALTSTTFATYAYDGKVDLFACALGICAAYWASVPVENGQATFSVRIAGLAAGLACVAKFSYIPTLIPGLLVLLFLRARRQGTWAVGAEIVNFGVAAAVAILPHLIKNAMFFGEPLAPFVVSSKQDAWLESNVVWYGAEATRWIVLTYPLALVFGRYPMQEGNISFVWLAFLPWIADLRHPKQWLDNKKLVIGIAGLVGVAIWVVLRPSIFAPRYYLPSLLLLLVPAAGAIERLSEPAFPRLVSAAAVACLIVAMLATLEPLARPREPYRYVAGRDRTCQRASLNCEGFLRLNQQAANNDRVFVATYYTYWLRPDLMLCRSTHAEGAAITKAPTDASLWEMLLSMGFKYVVVDTTTYRQFAWRLATERVPPSAKIDTVATGTPLQVFRLTSTRMAHPRSACMSSV